MADQQKLVFVTGNANKLREVKELVGSKFPFQITNRKIDLPEYQGEADDITKRKCLIAYEEVEEAVLIEDTCLCFNALDGLPGPYIKWFLDKIGCEGLYKILKGFKDKSAVAVCTFGFRGKDDEEILLFKGKVEGDIVFPRGDNNFGWDNCFQPKGYDKTFAEMDSLEKNEISHRRRAIDALREHFSSNNTKKRKLEEVNESPEKKKNSPNNSNKKKIEEVIESPDKRKKI